MNIKVLVILSLAANVVLGGLYYSQLSKKPEAPAPAVANTAKSSQANPIPSPSAAPATTIQIVEKAIDWRAVESEDYRKYIANLKSIGCPKETIKDIIVADVNKLFAERRKLIATGGKKFEFWKTGNPMAALMDPEKIEKQQELTKEKKALLKELLGEDVEDSPEQAMAAMNPFGSMLDFLPEAKQAQVMELMQKFQAKIMKGFGSGGAPDAEDLKQIKSVQKEMDAELAKIMTPEEKQNYDLAMSQTAMVMRMQLSTFEPSEQEFRDMFKLKKAFDDEYSIFGMPPQDKEGKESYNAAKKELDDALRKQLGDARFNEYQMAQDYNYQAIAKITAREGLPKESAAKVYDMKKAAEAQAKTVRNDKNLSQEQRTAALAAIRNATEQAMSQTLGQKGFSTYQSNPTSGWLKNISPDPK